MKNTRIRTIPGFLLPCFLAMIAVVGGSAGQARAQFTSGPCCLPNGSCTVTFQSTCSSQGGVIVNGRDGCTGIVCTPTGACCLSNGACSQLSQSACGSSGGEYRGNGTVCASQTCGGACCQTDGTCVISNAPTCSAPEIFHGLGSLCADVDCVGGCCAGDGSCVLTTEFDCQNNRDGQFLGLEATCAGAICTGACCLPNKSCFSTGPTTCASFDGLFQGLGSVCGDDCPTAMPTAFTYQGQLKRQGIPVNGLIDARFSLWLSPTGEDPPNRIGGVLARNAMEVVNGLFNVELDFGQNAFNGNARWLQVELRDEESDAFTTLQPRQPLTPVPYALQTRGIVVRQDGNVGIGTKSAQSPLHVAGTGFNNSGLQPGVHIARDGAGNAKIELVNNGGAPYIDFINDGNTDFDGRIRLTADDSLAIEGVRLGIGTTAPDVRLHATNGTDAEPNGGGYIQAGLTSGQNVVFDENEIMARNNGAPSTLFLNNDGGAVQIGVNSVLDIGIENLNVVVQDTGTASLNCPAGKQALSGGCVCVGAILVSQPTGTGWFCDCRDDNFVQVFVRCARVK